MAKAPDPAKPNTPKVDISPVMSGAGAPPSMPFSGRDGMDGTSRSNMAMGMLQSKPANLMQYDSPESNPMMKR